MADRLLQHRFQYLGIGEVELGEEIRWNFEYKRGLETPSVFGPTLDYRDTNKYGDFKYFWEVPRLQHLMTLAKAFRLTRDARYAREVVAQIEAFLESSPYLLGVNWVMPMEASIRLMSFAWTLAFLDELSFFSDATLFSLVESLLLHVDYVRANYAKHSSANNHLIGEACGVFIASLAFGFSDRIKRAGAEAYEILVEEAEKQFAPDGVNKEQAVHYQVFAHMFLLAAGIIGRNNNREFPAAYWQALEKSATFLGALTDQGGTCPQIGDSDDGRALPLGGAGHNATNTVLSTAAVLFARPDLKAKAKKFDETAYWLLGPEGKSTFEVMKSSSPAQGKSWAFTRGGYCVYASAKPGGVHLVFDCGPLGYKSIAAHGHADALSFTMSLGGQPVLIDPGTYTYVADDPYREYFRSTLAHNTVVVNGASQSESAGPFLWARKADCNLDRLEETPDYWLGTAEHDGFSRLATPVWHRRSIRIGKRTDDVTITDDLSGEDGGSFRAARMFHFAPQWRAELVRPGEVLAVAGEKAVSIIYQGDDTRVSTTRGTEAPILGWASEEYDVKVSCVSLCLENEITGEASLLTVIRKIRGW